MSKLIVKNLPNGITEERLRKLFEAKGTLTDVNLKYTKNGVFRKFAFLGFFTEDEASKAQEYFNNTFIDTAKIQVEICKSLNDPEKPRAWSQHSADSSRFQAAHKPLEPPVSSPYRDTPDSEPTDKEDRIGQLLRNPLLSEEERSMLEKARNNPEFLQFLQVQRKGPAKSLWHNDDAMEAVKKPGKKEEKMEVVEEEKEGGKGKGKGKEQPNKMKNAVKMKHLPKGVNKEAIRAFFKPLEPTRVYLPKKAKDIAFIQFGSKEDAMKAVKLDKKQLSGTAVLIVLCTDADSGDTGQTEEQDDSPAVNGKVLSSEGVADSGRLFVRNLSFLCTMDNLETLFSKYGPVSEVLLPTDFVTKRCKGYGIVSFMMPEHAVEAMNALDGKDFQGRTLHVLPAKARPESEFVVPADGGGNSSFKKEKSSKEKQSSQKVVHSWNSLFIGSNAVVDVMAERYNVKKGDVLAEQKGASTAVRLALGETQIVNETRQFLLDHGVNLDAFAQVKGPRSKEVIVVKQLPAGTSSAAIMKLFQPFGSVSRVLLPPSGVSALVEMLDPFEAQKAFRALAYSKQFGSLPLFLEWAPLEALKAPVRPAVDTTETIETKPEPAASSEAKPDMDEPAEEEEEPRQEGACLFVKNLSFATTDEQLHEFFSGMGKIRSATVARKKNPKGGLLSMGYGFVEFATKDLAQKAIKQLQNHLLDGHALQLKISEQAMRNANDKEDRRKGQSGDKTVQGASKKIVVRNVAFQASEKELRDMFKVFGEIKSLRLPLKMAAGGSGQHRGFCFVEFNTKSDAKRAFDALCQSTHLYGRRLVLEWAQSDQDDDVQALREKVSHHFHPDQPGRKKLKKSNLRQELDSQVAAEQEDEAD